MDVLEIVFFDVSSEKSNIVDPRSRAKQVESSQ